MPPAPVLRGLWPGQGAAKGLLIRGRCGYTSPELPKLRCIQPAPVVSMPTQHPAAPNISEHLSSGR